MSYDIHLEVDTGGSEPAEVGSPWNYTSNCAPMWRLAMPETDGLAGMDGMVAWEAAVFLRRAVRLMAERPDEYRALDPPNGWGDSLSAHEALCDLLHDCDAHPKATVRVNR